MFAERGRRARMDNSKPWQPNTKGASLEGVFADLGDGRGGVIQLSDLTVYRLHPNAVDAVKEAHPEHLSPSGQTVRITFDGDESYTATLRQESA
jgi:hypothetical protein